MNDHPDGSPTKDTIDVECNPNIRRLTVRAGILPQLASYVKYLLSRLSAPNIQQITITMTALPWPRQAMNWQGWNEVDRVLDGVKFRGLRGVAIVVNTYEGMDVIRLLLTNQLPSMYKRGIPNIIAQEQ
jgi:hypothetical protein